ncbi:hypothetical protein ACFYNO_04925 [Kitasatospora sp. NPDC006697]
MARLASAGRATGASAAGLPERFGDQVEVGDRTIGSGEFKRYAPR